ncbi:MAG: M24 family metallopeptidase [Calothrix sp. MO_167.B12]|nr:M24 family metallopeptidase [Calothrix sp. MO_167.B12]
MNDLLCTDSNLEHQLICARNRGLLLIEHIKMRNLIQAGCETRKVQKAIYELAAQILYPVDQKPRFWHRQILRVGEDTINPYSVKVRNHVIKPGDIVFFDLGPVLNIEVNSVFRMEADLGRSMIVPSPNIDPDKVKICNDCERIFLEGKAYYLQNQDMTGKDLYEYMQHSVRESGWKLSSQLHSGHLIGVFPHERILGDTQFDYICLENTRPMSAPDKFGNKRHWILETHLVHPKNLFGSFYEDLLIST